MKKHIRFATILMTLASFILLFESCASMRGKDCGCSDLNRNIKSTKIKKR